jgi:hypothetical protein
MYIYADDFQFYAADDISNLRFFAGQLTMNSFSMARKHKLILYARIRLPSHVLELRLGDLVVYTNKVINLGITVDSRVLGIRPMIFEGGSILLAGSDA